MPTRASLAAIAGPNVHLRPPAATDAAAFVAAVRASRSLHEKWTHPPDTRARFTAYVKRHATRSDDAKDVGFLILHNADGALVGAINFSEIVRGGFHSAYAGYYAFASQAGRGYMTEGMALALDTAFRRLELHRVEINVQPSNLRSIALVERLGFIREGYSRRYLKIAGRWRDHVRFAMLAEDWRSLRRHHLGRDGGRA